MEYLGRLELLNESELLPAVEFPDPDLLRLLFHPPAVRRRAVVDGNQLFIFARPPRLFVLRFDLGTFCATYKSDFKRPLPNMGLPKEEARASTLHPVCPWHRRYSAD